MIRNVCIHVTNEQPLLCDLFSLPSSADAGLVCTNVRSMDGKRPIFIDHMASTFFFPYHVVRFLEIPERSMAEYVAGRGGAGPAAGSGAAEGPPGDAYATLYGYGNGGGDAEQESLLPVAVGAAETDGDDGLDFDIEIDEDFLKRVRDI